jgi:DNA-binding FrmR family transcriptional regulator
MGHTVKDKSKLLNRVRRLRGQVEAIERALEAEAGCAEVMQLVVSVRGAANGLMAEVIEDHVRIHICDPAHDRDAERTRGVETAHRRRPAFIHVASETTFVLNSARLLPAADRLNAVATKADARAVAKVA